MGFAVEASKRDAYSLDTRIQKVELCNIKDKIRSTLNDFA